MVMRGTVVLSVPSRPAHPLVEVARRPTEVERRQARPLALRREELPDGDQVFRVGLRVTAEVDELGGDFSEERLALRSDGAVESL